MKLFSKLNYLVLWFVSVALVTILCGLVFVTVHQDYRQSANDPQIQVAEDIALGLNNGKVPTDFDSPNKIDIARSIAPYFIIYDSQGQPVVSSGVIDGKMPKVPVGVLEVSQKYGENRVTWEPRIGVRSAIVAVPFRASQSGFVVAGRSLRETENRIERLTKTVLLVWFVTIILIGLVFLLLLLLSFINE